MFPRNQPYGSDECSSLGKVYSRQATESVNCENSSVFFVMKYCPTSTVVRNPASVQNLITRSCCDHLSIRSWYLCNRSSSCAGSSVTSLCAFNNLARSNNGSGCAASTGLPVLGWQVLYLFLTLGTSPCSYMARFAFFTHFCDCSVNTEPNNRKNV